MNKEQFKNLENSLYKKGYKKYLQNWYHEDFVLGKGFHKKDNKWEEDGNAYQIGLSIYDWSSKPDLWDRLSQAKLNRVGIEVHINVSRTIDERTELYLPWKEDTTIEEIESYAESFYQWVCTQWPKPEGYDSRGTD